MSILEKLEDIRQHGYGSSLLYFALGHEYIRQKNWENAIAAFQQSIKKNPNYTAAWKMLGKVYLYAGLPDKARQTLSEGLAIAEIRNDSHNAREMRFFLKQLQE